MFKYSIDSGHKQFDKLVSKSGIGTGNVISDGQRSSFIRGFNEVECNGRVNAPGDLQEFDLIPFSELPKEVMNKVKVLAKDKSVILYEFRTFKKVLGRNVKVIHGYVITNAQHQCLYSFSKKVSKSIGVIESVLSILFKTREVPLQLISF